MKEKQPNKHLRRARELKGWSQQTLAERLGTNEQVVSRWESGQHLPNRHFQTQLCLLFEKNAQELGLIKQQETTEILYSQHYSSDIRMMDGVGNRASRVSEEYLSLLAEFSLEEDFTGLNNARRQLLQNLLVGAIGVSDIWNFSDSWPLKLLSTLELDDSGIDEIHLAKLEKVTASGWQLLKSDGLVAAEYLLPTYLPYIATFTRQTSKYQERAASITSQGYLLAGLIAVLNMQPAESERHCKKAVFYAKLAKDRNLEVAALKHLATKFLDNNHPMLALQTYQEATKFIDEVSPLLRSRIYLGLALAYAQDKQKTNALYYLDIARETFPDNPENDPGFSYADCGISSLYHYGGLIHVEFDEFEKARDTFQQVEANKLLSIIPERTRLEIMNCQAQASIALKDFHSACELIEKSVEGATKLQSEKRYNDTLALYRQICFIWPHNQETKALADLFRR